MKLACTSCGATINVEKPHDMVPGACLRCGTSPAVWIGDGDPNGGRYSMDALALGASRVQAPFAPGFACCSCGFARHGLAEDEIGQMPVQCPNCGANPAAWRRWPRATRSHERRPSWSESFMAHARIAAARSTCKRKQVGAVLTRDNLILSAGYAGAARGRPHCTDLPDGGGPPRGCLLGPDGGCKRTVHAEVNAVLNAARHGVSTAGTVLYCTLSPCWACLLMLHNAGVVRVVYAERYRIFDEVEAEARAMGLRLHRLEDAITEEEVLK